ncbi:phosphoribosylformylglycinamidine synthase subunit PurQ [Litoreibacter roseus]|uniref:Phosphoribosylformylglycinamidine synthase subunit PurQ n=1 Tax=Litoreibacter roseus TaxID=2601869 RepID=A0A6N6JCR2_9RHOB|nr:phosphoribosylformylglycinamidine synthase subunit PurQ [Litoreibacter roseus]GFE64131.1 phosphoribosylformylglycinamidine synthase subunit PurQ [Litoreibacter roseus]
MKAAVIVFPGSNCDRDLAEGFRKAGADVNMVWHKDTDLPEGIDIVGVPGGFSFGDYLRCGAIAARSPISQAVVAFAQKGGHVLGICNGFQVLCETGLLPGVLMRNAGLKFVCRQQVLRVETQQSPFTQEFAQGAEITIPIAHHDGNYSVADEEMKQLQDQDRIAFRYIDNPNGSMGDIAGVLSENRRVLGMMPHPERAVEDPQGGTDGAKLFASLTRIMTLA